MSANQETNVKGTSQQNAESGKQDAAGAAGETVQLDASTYGALLDRLDELEAAAGATSTRDEHEDGLNPEEQLERQTRGAAPKGPPDLERLSNQQLAQFIASELQNDVLQPLLVRIAGLELSLEEKDLRSDYEDKEEFDRLKPEAYKILNRTPSLKLSEAFKLAKKDQPKGEKAKSDTTQTTSRDRLRHLPPRPAIHGEKPSGAAVDSTDRARPKSTREAAERALEELNVRFPEGGKK